MRKINSSITESSEHFFLPRFSEGKVLAGILIAANTLAIFFTLIPLTNLADFTWQSWMRNAFFINWVAVVFAILADALRKWLIVRPRREAMIYGLVLFEIVVLMFTFIASFGEAFVWRMPFSFQDCIHLAIKHVVLAGIGGGLTMQYLYTQEQSMIQQRNELLLRVDALQARIRPHFLFNSMNTLRSLIAIDKDTAECVVDDLSALFRASLNAAREVSILDEISLCKRYVSLEQLRFGDRLRVVWRLPDDDILYDLNIPSLTIQPILENAFYHGVETRLEPSTVTVFIEYIQNEVRIVVTNPFETGKKKSGNGIALDNIRERLQVYYGKSAKLSLSEREGMYTTFISYKDQGQIDHE